MSKISFPGILGL